MTLPLYPSLTADKNKLLYSKFFKQWSKIILLYLNYYPKVNSHGLKNTNIFSTISESSIQYDNEPRHSKILNKKDDEFTSKSTEPQNITKNI